MSRADSIFVANVKDYSIHFAEDTPYYAKIDVEVLHTIYGNSFADDITLYLIEDQNESLRDFLGKGVYVIGIIPGPPEYIYFKNGKRQVIPLTGTDSDARLIYNQSCYYPFFIKYSEAALERIEKYLEFDIKKKSELVK